MADQSWEEQADALRRNFARYLAPLYLENPLKIADLCDNELDRRGTLLGYVREYAGLLDTINPTAG